MEKYFLASDDRLRTLFSFVYMRRYSDDAMLTQDLFLLHV